MSCVRVMNENFSDLDVVSNFTWSSQQAAFPATNVLNRQRRSKVWRSNGYWEVVSGDNVIVFQEDGITDLNATITAGTYATTAAFMTAVKTALEAVGTSTYTITQNANFKFVITSNGFGGNTLDIIWTDPSSAGMAAVMGYSTASDDNGLLTYTADELRIHTHEYLLFDFGISTNPEAFILTGPRNEPAKLSPGSVVKLQGNETNNFTTPSYEQTLTYDEENMALFSDTGLHTGGLRYWRVYIEDQNPLGYVEIGVAFLGDYYNTSRGVVEYPLESGLIDRSVTVFSEGGQTYADILPKSQSFTLQWSALTKDEIEQLVDNVFDKVGTSVPFFIQLDPNTAFSSKSTKYLRYVKFADAPTWRLESMNYFKMAWNLREEL